MRETKRLVLVLLRTVPRREVARVVGVTVSAVDKWAEGSSRPNEARLKLLRERWPDVFDCRSDAW